MKSDLTKRIVAGATAATLVLGMSTFAFADGDSDADSDADADSTAAVYDEDISFAGDLEEYVYSVTLPTDAVFALDPFESANGRVAASAPGQIYGDYVYTNAGDFPVRITYDLEVEGAAGQGTAPSVQFVSKRADVDPDNLAVQTKNVYFGVIGASGVTGSGTYDQTTAAVDAASIIFEPSDDKSKAAGKFTIALDNASENNSGSKDGAFSFYAELDTYASWKAGDLTIAGTYTLTGLKPSTLTALGTGTGTGGVELVKTGYTLAKHGIPWPAAPTSISENATKAGFVLSNGRVAATQSVTYSKSAATDVEVPFIMPIQTNSTDGGVTPAVAYTAFTSAKINTATYAATDLEYKMIDGKPHLVLKGNGKLVFGGTTGGPYDLVITYGTNTYTLKVTITA